MSTKYPLVFIHGAGGFDKIFNLTYFYNIEGHLEENGYEVYVPRLTAYDRIEKRAKQIVDYVDSLNLKKVNLIGHSLGGVDARFAISEYGLSKKVASLTTVSSPHWGTSAIDVILGIIPCKVCYIASKAMATVGMDFDVFIQMSKTYMVNEFNPKVLDVPDVKYFSWSTKASLKGKNKVKPFMLGLYLILLAVDGPNDGMVSVESAKWGEWLGTLEADHYGVIGQPLGMTNFDHLDFFLKEAKRLESLGF